MLGRCRRGKGEKGGTGSIFPNRELGILFQQRDLLARAIRKAQDQRLQMFRPTAAKKGVKRGLLFKTIYVRRARPFRRGKTRQFRLIFGQRQGGYLTPTSRPKNKKGNLHDARSANAKGPSSIAYKGTREKKGVAMEDAEEAGNVRLGPETPHKRGGSLLPTGGLPHPKTHKKTPPNKKSSGPRQAKGNPRCQ